LKTEPYRDLDRKPGR